MSEELEKSELLEDFQKYLQQSNLDSFATNEQPDLNTLLSELTALKTEVKTESRQFKNTLETLSSALTTVQDENKALSAERIENILRLEKQQTEVIRTMLLDFVDIYDRLTLGGDVLHNYHPVNSLFKHSRKKDVLFIKRFREGQAMTIKRFEQLLQRYHVYPIDCLRKSFDPLTMRAVETVCFPEIESGRVIEELRKGFLFQDQVLRLAEVRVNKISYP
jgi:molecular chaperone GrpE